MKFKKFLSILLAAVMTMSLGLTALAADEPVCEHKTLFTFFWEFYLGGLDIENNLTAASYVLVYYESTAEFFSEIASEEKELTENFSAEAYGAFYEKYHKTDEYVSSLSNEIALLKAQYEAKETEFGKSDFSYPDYYDLYIEYNIKKECLAFYEFTNTLTSPDEEGFSAETAAAEIAENLAYINHRYFEDYEETVIDEYTQDETTRTHYNIYRKIRDSENIKEQNEFLLGLTHNDFEIAPTATCTAKGTNRVVSFCPLCKSLLVVDDGGTIIAGYPANEWANEHKDVMNALILPETYLEKNETYAGLYYGFNPQTDEIPDVFKAITAEKNTAFTEAANAVLSAYAGTLEADGYTGLKEHSYADRVCTVCGAEEPGNPAEEEKTDEPAEDDVQDAGKGFIAKIKIFFQKIMNWFSSIFRK